MRPAILTALLLVAACQQDTLTHSAAIARSPGPEAPPTGPYREQLHWIPVADRLIQARLCRPERPGAAPLAVINHGSPASTAQRRGMAPDACTSDAAAWFLARGYAVMLPLRRGYGAAGGTWSETFGSCADPDYARAGRETARDIAAAVDYAAAAPDIRPDRVLVIGHSAGGWGALALASQNPPRIGAVINMAGGRGGWAGGVPNANCRPDQLVAAAAEYGRTARLPTLWIYTANDSFFAPDLAARLHAAYAEAGAPAHLEPLDPWGHDGHDLFGAPGGSSTWGPILERWLIATSGG